MTVIAHHLIWTAYGWWLPNDPRGSMSRTIREDLIAQLGELHYGRKKVQPASRDIRKFYSHAAEVLKHELLVFTESERSVLAGVFEEVIRQQRYTCYACAIMPDHVHMVIRRHRHLAEEMIQRFQAVSRLRFRAEGLRGADHRVWGGPGWKVFLDDPEDVWRTIPYVEDNPVKIRLPSQQWPSLSPTTTGHITSAQQSNTAGERETAADPGASCDPFAVSRQGNRPNENRVRRLRRYHPSHGDQQWDNRSLLNRSSASRTPTALTCR